MSLWSMQDELVAPIYQVDWGQPDLNMCFGDFCDEIKMQKKRKRKKTILVILMASEGCISYKSFFLTANLRLGIKKYGTSWWFAKRGKIPKEFKNPRDCRQLFITPMRPLPLHSVLCLSRKVKNMMFQTTALLSRLHHFIFIWVQIHLQENQQKIEKT